MSNSGLNSLYNLDRQKKTRNLSDTYYIEDGYREISDLISYYIQSAENPKEILKAGAKEYLKDLYKLTKPLSRIRNEGYTHLIESFGMISVKDEVIVGWNKYYGKIVEKGSVKMNPRPHMEPVWQKNSDRYYKVMLTKLGKKTW